VSGQAPGNKLSILLVDDEATDVLFMETVIEKAGRFQVTTEGDGARAIDLIRSGEWDLAIVDLFLPGADGIDVIRAGREAHPDLPIMLVTASSNSLLIDAAFRAGADYRISKPIDGDEVLSKLVEFLGAGTTVEAAPRTAEAPPATVEAAPSAPTVLAIGACPGDVEMGCGGILSKHRQEGHQVHIVNLAGGGDPGSTLSGPAGRSAEILGAEVRCVGAVGDHIADLEEATKAVEETIAQVSPAMLYVPTLATGRQSSLESHRVTLAAAEGVTRVLAYESPMATMDFRPDFFVDIAPFLDQKLEMLGCYEELALPNVSSELARAAARYWGRLTDPKHAESFEVIRGVERG
jgi:CheY-like chemotaxis protein